MSDASPPPDSAALLADAAAAAKRAGTILRRMFHQRPEGRFKANDRDYVTDADLAADRAIIEYLRSRYPGHTIQTEESGVIDEGAPYRWVVDPLDGTGNFAHGFPHFCVSIALLHEGRAVVGAIHDPMRGETFTAALGRGARRNGRRIAVSAVEALSGAMITTGFPYYPREQRAAVADLSARVIEKVQLFRRSGSAALDFAYVAAGRLEAHWEFGLSLHDYAAGALLIHEAGGHFEDMRLDPYAPGYLGSNGRALHDDVVALHRQHLGPVVMSGSPLLPEIMR